MRSFPFTTRSKRARKERQRKGRKKNKRRDGQPGAEVQKKKKVGGGTITEERRITSKVSFYKCKYSVISSFNRCTAQLCVATLSYA